MIVCTSLIGTLGKLTPHLGFGFKFSLQEVGHFKLLGCQQRSGLASSLQKLLDAGTGAVEFMIANGTIGGSSKIATVEIRLKCSARTHAYFECGVAASNRLRRLRTLQLRQTPQCGCCAFVAAGGFQDYRVVWGDGPPRA